MKSGNKKNLLKTAWQNNGRNTVISGKLGTQRGRTHVVKGASCRSRTITNLRPEFREGLTRGRDDIGFRIRRYLYGGENE